MTRMTSYCSTSSEGGLPKEVCRYDIDLVMAASTPIPTSGSIFPGVDVVGATPRFQGGRVR